MCDKGPYVTRYDLFTFSNTRDILSRILLYRIRHACVLALPYMPPPRPLGVRGMSVVTQRAKLLVELLEVELLEVELLVPPSTSDHIEVRRRLM